MERVHTIVIGAGQAGLAVSHELAARGVPHRVLDAGRIGETWRTRRWRSFRLVSPNHFTHLPGLPFGGDPHGFADAAEIVAYLETYAASFGAPLDTGVRVRAVDPGDDGGFVVDTSGGRIAATAVVIATGAFGDPRVPAIAADLPEGIASLHADSYWAPEDVRPGGVLVVGAGQSGLQIAHELALAGRRVILAVGRHGWVPRRLFGRDQNYWRQVNGDFEVVVAHPDRPVLDYPFSPIARWGTTDFNVRTVWQAGVRLTGHLEGFDGSAARFAPDLRPLLAAGDAYASTFIERVTRFARARGEDVTPHPRASHWQPGEMPDGPAAVDLASEGIGSVIWGTGYVHDYSWIRVPGALAATAAGRGAPVSIRGVSPVKGLYFVGQHRLWESASGTLLGCGWAATHVADVIAKRARVR